MAGTWKEVLDNSKLGVANGVAQLDASALLPTAQIPNIDAGKITSGTLADARIPSLNASKINAGTFAAAQIPALDAGKITTGALGVDRIPSLDAGKITTGTLGSDRIPTLDQSKISGLATALAGKVSTTQTINGQALSGNITLNTANLIEKVSTLPASGSEGQMVLYNGSLYVYKES